MSDYRQKLKNYESAVERLQEGILKLQPSNDLLRDGLIQRFEFTFELAWKTLKSMFEYEGLRGLNSPKMIIREAFSSNIILNEDMWLSMLNDRNSTAHIYSEEIAKKICSAICEKYFSELYNLMQEIKKRNISWE